MDNCWGEGEHATLRSTTSSPLHADEGYIDSVPEQAGGAAPDGDQCDPFVLVLLDEGPAEVYGPPALPSSSKGPCVIQPMVMGPARSGAIRDVSVTGFTLMTICNLPSWEYFGDKPGTRGSKRLWQGHAAPRVPINTPVQCPTYGGLSFWHSMLNFANTLSSPLLDQLAEAD
jgi:hypothetical protein